MKQQNETENNKKAEPQESTEIYDSRLEERNSCMFLAVRAGKKQNTWQAGKTMPGL